MHAQNQVLSLLARSNAIGPLIGIWLLATTGAQSAKTASPIWILAFGGIAISVGVAVWGSRVMATIGKKLTVVTPSSAFVIELGAAIMVLVASNFGLPVSSTHCEVGHLTFTFTFSSGIF